jgi:ribonuclease D
MGTAILKAVAHALTLDRNCYPTLPERMEKSVGLAPLMDLLKVMLKLRCEQTGVAQKLVATVSELERFAAGDENSPLLSGWRRELFGDLALALTEGRVALTVLNDQICIIPQDAEAAKLAAPPRRTKRSRRRAGRNKQAAAEESATN